MISIRKGRSRLLNMCSIRWMESRAGVVRVGALTRFWRRTPPPPPPPPPPPEPDWGLVRSMVVSLADVLGTYHTALLNADFSEEEAFALVSFYQATLVVGAEQ